MESRWPKWNKNEDEEETPKAYSIKIKKTHTHTHTHTQNNTQWDLSKNKSATTMSSLLLLNKTNPVTYSLYIKVWVYCNGSCCQSSKWVLNIPKSNIIWHVWSLWKFLDWSKWLERGHNIVSSSDKCCFGLTVPELHLTHLLCSLTGILANWIRTFLVSQW